MADQSPPSTPLFAAFPKSSAADWAARARESLKGRSLESLPGETEDGLPREPIYSEASCAQLLHLQLVDPPGAVVEGELPAAWEIRQHPQCTEAAALGRELAWLAARGQQILPLTLGRQVPRDGQALGRLLSGLPSGKAVVELEAGPEVALAHRLLGTLPGGPHVLLADWISPALIQGKHPLATTARDLAHLWAASNPEPLSASWLASGVTAHEAGASPAQELACWLACWTAGLRDLEEAGAPLEEALAGARHELAAGREVFDTMAKLRAARLLAARVLEACGRPPEQRRIVLRVRGALRTQTRHDPWTNLLRATLQGFAAGVGGADSLHLPSMAEGLGQTDEQARRLAANTQVILQEEAHLARVADPGRGSWYLESLTAGMAEAAWSLFQDLESAGGWWAALVEGLPQGWIREAAERRAARLARRREALVGTSVYPNLAEKLPDWARDSHDPEAVASTGDDFAPLRPRRLAEELEALRRRGEAAATQGAGPVWLACCGPLRQHKARADFCRGLLAAGGWRSIQGEGAADGDLAAAAAFQSGAPVTILCSTDESYPELAPAFVAGLRRREGEAGRRPALILLAGHPPEQVDALRDAGVAGFLHVKGSMSDLFTQILHHVEVST
jgi:methylmalonyl-CoA mutase